MDSHHTNGHRADGSIKKRTLSSTPAKSALAEHEQLGLEQMKKMSPFQNDDAIEVSLCPALLCHVMLLNSVLERSANRFVEEYGLTFPQWMALGCIGSGGEEGVRHSELGQRLMLSKAPVTGVVDRLERAGLVKRVNDPEDRRASRVVMTPEGRSLWMTVREALHERADNLCGCFSLEEQQAFLSFLSRLLTAASADDHTLGASLCGSTKADTTKKS